MPEKLIYIYVLILIARQAIVAILWRYLQPRKIYIRDWRGRLGNNLIQIAHAIFLARKTSASILAPPHSSLKLSSREIGIQIYDIPTLSRRNVLEKIASLKNGKYKPILKSLVGYYQPPVSSRLSLLDGAIVRDFFYNYDLLPWNRDLTLRDYREIYKNHLFYSIDFHQTQAKIPDRTLVIHMRSGDIFREKPHRGLTQPPLSFYLKVIENSQPQSILIVTQDTLNPCIDRLKQLFPDQVEIQSSSLPNDIGTILLAQNLVLSHSTFALGLAFAAPHLKHLYLPRLKVRLSYERVKFWPALTQLFYQGDRPIQKGAKDLDFKLTSALIKNYIQVGNWRNEVQQQQVMLEHPIENVVLQRWN